MTSIKMLQVLTFFPIQIQPHQEIDLCFQMVQLLALQVVSQCISRGKASAPVNIKNGIAMIYSGISLMLGTTIQKVQVCFQETVSISNFHFHRISCAHPLRHIELSFGFLTGALPSSMVQHLAFQCQKNLNILSFSSL